MREAALSVSTFGGIGDEASPPFRSTERVDGCSGRTYVCAPPATSASSPIEAMLEARRQRLEQDAHAAIASAPPSERRVKLATPFGANLLDPPSENGSLPILPQSSPSTFPKWTYATCRSKFERTTDPGCCP
jgi:hypothetical protein